MKYSSLMIVEECNENSRQKELKSGFILTNLFGSQALNEEPLLKVNCRRMTLMHLGRNSQSGLQLATTDSAWFFPQELAHHRLQKNHI